MAHIDWEVTHVNLLSEEPIAEQNVPKPDENMQIPIRARRMMNTMQNIIFSQIITKGENGT